MEKAQARIDPGSVERDLSRPRIIGHLTIGLEGDLEHVCFYLRSHETLWLTGELEWHSGELKAHDAAVAADLYAAGIYQWLMEHIGFQDELEI